MRYLVIIKMHRKHLLVRIAIIEKKNHPYTEQQKDFQLYRRGRYVEFNLLHDELQSLVFNLRADRVHFIAAFSKFGMTILLFQGH